MGFSTFVKAFIVLLIFGTATLHAVGQKFSSDLLMEAAYFGDEAYLESEAEKYGGWQEFSKKNKNSFQLIIHNAINGEQVDLLNKLVQPWWFSWSISDYFKNKRMTPVCADIFLKTFSNMPDWKTKALNLSILSKNPSVMEYFINKGVKPDASTIASALANQDYTLCKKLIDAGADPYKKRGGLSLVQQAIRTKSAKLIRLLDPEGRYIEDLKKIEVKIGTRENSKYPGWWVYQKEGFGSSSINLIDDGTGTFYSDVGGMAFVWHEDKDTLTLMFLRYGNYIEGQNMVLIKDGDVLVREKRGEGASPVWVRKKDNILEVDLGLDPLFIKFEGCYLSKDLSRLYVVINGKYSELNLEPLFKLKNQAKGIEAMPENAIQWKDFINKPLSNEVRDRLYEVPYVNKNASLAYTRNGVLMRGHKEMAVLQEGADFTVFYTEGSTQKYQGIYPQKFSVLSKEKFPNGLNVFEFYFVKNRLTRSL